MEPSQLGSSLLPPEHWVMCHTSYWLLLGLVSFFGLVTSEFKSAPLLVLGLVFRLVWSRVLLPRPALQWVMCGTFYWRLFNWATFFLPSLPDKQFLPGPGRSPRLNCVISCKAHNFHRNWHPRRIPILDSPSCSFLRLMVMSWELSELGQGAAAVRIHRRNVIWRNAWVTKWPRWLQWESHHRRESKYGMRPYQYFLEATWYESMFGKHVWWACLVNTWRKQVLGVNAFPPDSPASIPASWPT